MHNSSVEASEIGASHHGDETSPPRTRKNSGMLLAGSLPGSASGNAVSTEVMRAALGELGPVQFLSHRASVVPGYQVRTHENGTVVELGTQPFAIHGEALLAGRLHRRRLRQWCGGWAVNSRYAGALLAADIPYGIWEATLTADELRSGSAMEARASGRGTGLGVLLHSASLPVGKRIERLLYRRAAVLCTMSVHTRDRIISEHGIDRSHVALLPHPPSPTYMAALDRGKLLHGVSTQRPPDGKFRVLFVGRVDDPRKNVKDLLIAVCRMRERRIGVELTIVGPFSKSWRSQFSTLIADADARLVGRIDAEHLAEQYLRNDVFVLPSRQEGFGVVVSEAFHAGLPVISTMCGGPEDVIRNSNGGLLVERNPDAIAAALQFLALGDEVRRKLACNAIEFAKRELTFRTFAMRVRDLNEIIVGGVKRPNTAEES